MGVGHAYHVNYLLVQYICIAWYTIWKSWLSEVDSDMCMEGYNLQHMHVCAQKPNACYG